MTRRDFFISLSGLAVARPGLMAQSQKDIRRALAREVDAVLPVRVSTLNHVSLSAASLSFTVRWYQRVFGMPIVYYQELPGAVGVFILRIGSGPSYIALTHKGPQGHTSSSKNDARTLLVPPRVGLGVKNLDVDRCTRALGRAGVGSAQVSLRENTTAEITFLDPDGFPLEFVDETNCGGGGYLGNLCDNSTTPLHLPGDPPPIAVRTLTHVTYVVSNRQRSLQWYQTLTDMQLQTQEAKRGPRTARSQGAPVPILRIAAGPQHLALIEGSDPLDFRPRFGLGLEGFDLDHVKKRLGEHGVPVRVGMREGVTRELRLNDPDGAEIQLQDASYCGGHGVLGNVCDSQQRAGASLR